MIRISIRPALPAALTALGLGLAACGGSSPPAAASLAEHPECRKARLLCGETDSPGLREACLYAARGCRQARTGDVTPAAPPEHPAIPETAP